MLRRRWFLLNVFLHYSSEENRLTTNKIDTCAAESILKVQESEETESDELCDVDIDEKKKSMIPDYKSEIETHVAQ